MSSSFKNINEFSWSLSRYNLFNFCKRAYYLNYYASWGGWETDAPAEKKLIYKLKHIKTLKEWFEELVIDALTKALRKEIESSLPAIKSYIFRKLYGELNSLSRSEFLKDAKKLCLFEHYYLNRHPENIKSEISDALNPVFDGIAKSDIAFLLKRNFLDFISINELTSFQLGRFKVWTLTNFIYHDRNEIILENIKFKDFRNYENWPLASAISLIYALKTLLKHNKSFTSKTKFVYDCKFLNVYATLNIVEAVQIILSSAEDMFKLHNASKEFFPKSDKKEKCLACKFNEACENSLKKL